MYSHFNFIRHNKYARTAAKKTLGYNETRTGKDGEEIERKLFGNSSPLTRAQAERLITTASNNTYFFRWILSPDLQEENAEKTIDLWQLARDGVLWLEERLKREGEIQLIGAEHDDHTGIPHVHALLLIKRRGREVIINKDDINAFREKVHALALGQREARRGAKLQEAIEAKQREAQQGREMQRVEQERQAPPLPAQVSQEVWEEGRGIGSGSGSGVAFEMASPNPCPLCGAGVLSKRPSSSVYMCDRCGALFRKGEVLRKSQEVQWSR